MLWPMDYPGLFVSGEQVTQSESGRRCRPIDAGQEGVQVQTPFHREWGKLPVKPGPKPS